jgi:hypothetical protein
MRGIKIIALASFAVLAAGGVQADAASAATKGATEYELCVKLIPKKLRYKGQPAKVPTGCHARMLVWSASEKWEVPGRAGWSGSYEAVGPAEVLVFSANNNPLCGLVAAKSATGYAGGEILLNESTQPGSIVCVVQAETWYTKQVRS